MKQYLSSAAWLMLALTLVLTMGCANRPVAETPGQAVIDAYGTLEKAAVVTTVLLQNDLISVDQAKKRRGDIREAMVALEAATAAINMGNLDTAIGKLQAAQLIVDTLARYVADNQENIR